MRAPTREKMISIMAEAGLAGGLLSEFGHWLTKNDHPQTTQSVVSDLQCGYSYWHAWC